MYGINEAIQLNDAFLLIFFSLLLGCGIFAFWFFRRNKNKSQPIFINNIDDAEELEKKYAEEHAKEIKKAKEHKKRLKNFLIKAEHEAIEKEVQKQHRSAKVVGYSAQNEGRRFYLKDYVLPGLSDSEILQNLMDDWGDRRTPQIYTEGINLHLTQTVYRPKKSAREVTWHGDGSIITIANGMDGIVPHPSLWDKQIGYSSGDDNLITFFDEMNLNNLIFRGGRIQFMSAAERQPVYNKVTFESGAIGLFAAFVMLGRTIDCKFQFHDRAGIWTRGGVSTLFQVNHMGAEPIPEYDGKLWSNATSTNSCSNGFEHVNPWVFSKPGQIAGVVTLHTDKNTYITPTIEGAPAKYGIYADSGNSPTANSLNVIRPHIEQGDPSVTEALIYSREYRSTNLNGVISHIDDLKLLHVEGNVGQVVFDELSYIPWNNGIFYSDPQIKWIFQNPTQGVSNAANWNRWEGTVPKEIFFNRGVDMYSLGSQGIALRSRTKINGRDQSSVFRVHGHTINQAGVNYLQRAKKYFVDAKSNWD